MTSLQEHSKNSNAISENNNQTNISNTLNISLAQLGYDEWFQSRNTFNVSEGFALARVIEVNKNNYKVTDGQHEMYAEISGKMLFNSESSLDFPTTGDWVVVQCFDDHSLAIIHHILPRKTLLKRKDPGKVVEFQLIGANIDYAFIIQAADANFNMNRLERYLVMVNESNIQPIIVLSKTDLLPADKLLEITDNIKRLNDKYKFLPISNMTGSGLKALQDELQPGKTYCLLGSSGVGKSTLLNNLLGAQVLEVNTVRDKDSKGKHTTTKRQLIRLETGSIFIDTPGMRELSNFSVDAGLEETFDEIAACSSQCRFHDCTHTHEDGCAVRAAVEQGTIKEERYQNYLKIQKEAAFYNMSYLDRRKRDKSFGKMVKDYKKSIRKK